MRQLELEDLVLRLTGGRQRKGCEECCSCHGSEPAHLTRCAIELLRRPH
jgi:hypothetical protein